MILDYCRSQNRLRVAGAEASRENSLSSSEGVILSGAPSGAQSKDPGDFISTDAV
jgi:hypothetical protein